MSGQGSNRARSPSGHSKPTTMLEPRYKIKERDENGPKSDQIKKIFKVKNRDSVIKDNKAGGKHQITKNVSQHLWLFK